MKAQHEQVGGSVASSLEVSGRDNTFPVLQLPDLEAGL